MERHNVESFTFSLSNFSKSATLRLSPAYMVTAFIFLRLSPMETWREGIGGAEKTQHLPILEGTLHSASYTGCANDVITIEVGAV